MSYAALWGPASRRGRRLHSARALMQIATPRRRVGRPGATQRAFLWTLRGVGRRRHVPCIGKAAWSPRGECVMNLYVWLPAMFALGLLTLGLMFAFVAACEKV